MFTWLAHGDGVIIGIVELWRGQRHIPGGDILCNEGETISPLVDVSVSSQIRAESGRWSWYILTRFLLLCGANEFSGWLWFLIRQKGVPLDAKRLCNRRIAQRQ